MDISKNSATTQNFSILH